MLTMFLQVSFSGVMHSSNAYSQDDLPKAVVRTLSQGSNVMSMDFHPQQQNILLGLFLKLLFWSSIVSWFILFFENFNYLFVVGTNVGDISLWELGSRERLVHKPFKVWEIQAVSMPLQVLYILTTFC